ncbi:XdhC family protein [Occultella aeris]|uniref:Putative xanthine dehydrogenase subunit A n=1 Tax=Occultella aeris TaxID=2761496 RepID=A0A7M4DS03_9MICO|nr:XdhC/CoxI family protein [Occultella aeris]VZO40247.1 putative xanthine dehydrogenase subunit A [Occultella aeris]
MYAVLDAIASEREPFALATVVSTWSSAPRESGARMLVRSDGSVVGSVSGGCVEGDVYALAGEVLADGAPRLVRYGVSDEVAGAVGLTCGGTIEVLVQRVEPGDGSAPAGDADAAAAALTAFAAAVAAGRATALATVVDGAEGAVTSQGAVLSVDDVGRASGATGSVWLDAALAADAAAVLETGRTAELTYGVDGSRQGVGIRVLVDVVAPPPRLIVAGVTDFAAAVVSMARFLGFEVTLCDARSAFATRARFPDAHEVVIDWPHRYLAGEQAAGRVDARTVVLVLTHDPKFDEPLLEVALGADVGFVGAMGSRRTHADRLERLRERGLDEQALSRLHSPVGLDLAGRSPRETAVSIMSHVVAARAGGSGRPLAELSGPIHRDAGAGRDPAPPA